MASGGYARKSSPLVTSEVKSQIPRRATLKLQESRGKIVDAVQDTHAPASSPLSQVLEPVAAAGQFALSLHPERIVGAFRPQLPTRHRPWMKLWVICAVVVTCFFSIFISVGIFQRASSVPDANYLGGQSYDVQVGGNLADSWQSNDPFTPKVAVTAPAGSYAVLSKPSISADFINQVLAAYHSPAAGKGQTLYDLGVQYNIDPAFALAFFMHESSFGTKGEATASLSLGNLRCIPNFVCRDNFAWFNTWEDGFKAWYELIRNYYVAQRGLVTVDQIIPVYAPPSDNNNDDAYINALKHAIDTWHAGVPIVI